MAGVARGRNGNIGGAIGGTSATVFKAKINQWQMRSRREIHDCSGFGDAGNTHDEEGVSYHLGSATGFIYVGTANNIDLTALSGTNSCAGTISLTADTGITFYGSVLAFNTEIGTAYRGGNVGVSFQFKIQGPLNQV